MEAVPRMPMIWLELKEAGEFQFGSGVSQVSSNTQHHPVCSGPHHTPEAYHQLDYS